MADLIPFPAARRFDLVAGITRRALELSPEAGEKHIQRSLDLQATVMRRKGIGENLIVRDVADLSAAIRAGIWQAVMSRKEG
ncbi:DUF6074 family protein [Bradyrhizobium sp. CCBAU 53338]|uniref:DUF6074 family protein n=1 Tax=Bradyrhizobium sp. CCBAU 53338 TaxID=1325111 RepID=UPI0018BFC973|nr:DUF6074 family protein [Bradyrhizobium sp. CCBAU 53338]QOZ52863.1 hypothetical protein XH90_16955 [Bradyrhizobium sp. CCBAU 53338]